MQRENIPAKTTKDYNHPHKILDKSYCNTKLKLNKNIKSRHNKNTRQKIISTVPHLLNT